MQKFLRTMMLLAALALPFASNAQVTADRTYLNQDFSVANPEGWTGGSGQMPTFNATGNPTWMHTAQAMNGLAAAPPGIRLRIGVSTSMKPRLSR